MSQNFIRVGFKSPRGRDRIARKPCPPNSSRRDEGLKERGRPFKDQHSTGSRQCMRGWKGQRALSFGIEDIYRSTDQFHSLPSSSSPRSVRSDNISTIQAREPFPKIFVPSLNGELSPLLQQWSLHPLRRSSRPLLLSNAEMMRDCSYVPLLARLAQFSILRILSPSLEQIHVHIRCIPSAEYQFATDQVVSSSHWVVSEYDELTSSPRHNASRISS